MRLDVNFIPHTLYRVSGWLEERWVDMGVCCNLVARSVSKTDVLMDVWAHIPPRLPTNQG